MADYWVCSDATCPFETNSGKQARKHEDESGHAVPSDDSEEA